jgi:exosome complex component RRP4
VKNMPVLYEKKQLVTPGELLAEGDFVAGDSTYKENDKIYATRIGLANFDGRKIYVSALEAFYVPYIGDLVIGKVVEVKFGGWSLDIRAPYLGTLRASEVLDRGFRPQKHDLPSIFAEDELVLCKVVAYDRTRDPLLTVQESGLGKITRGQIIEVTPTKIPRIIGTKGSMISMLKKETGCQITVCQNGLVLISGSRPEDEQVAVIAIRKIEQEAHTSGLTNRVGEMIRKEREGVEYA